MGWVTSSGVGNANGDGILRFAQDDSW
jgi:hypothetical protein